MPDAGSSQASQVPTYPEGVAEVASQGPHVGPRTHLHAHVQVHRLGRFVPLGRTLAGSKRPHRDRTGCERDVVASPYPSVRTHSVDLDGADCAGALLDVAGQRRDRSSDIRVEQLTRIRARGDLAVRIIGNASLA